MIELGANRYGKAAIRVVRVGRDTSPHSLHDLTVAVALEGDFTTAHTDGDNSLVVATDTMKNTAYAFAMDHLDGAIESYGQALAEHFLEFDQVETATVNIRGHQWRPIDVAGSPAPDAFVRGRRGHARRDRRRVQGRHDGRGRRRGSRRHEDDPLGVRGLPA